MPQYIDKDALVADIEKKKKSLPWGSCASQISMECNCKNEAYNDVISLANSMEVKEVDLDKESELIANGIMISIQSNNHGTNIYNTERNNFNHHHLQIAARKGIELGLKAQKGE